MRLFSGIAGRPRTPGRRCATTTARKALADVTAGVTVGLVALPLALAFAISSGLTPQAGIYTADRRRRPDLAARRLAPADRRSDRRLRRHRRRHRRRARRRGAVHLHADGRRDARRAGRHRHGIGGPIHSAAGRGRVHQRHRGPHRQHADPRFLRPAASRRCPASSCRGCKLLASRFCDLVAPRHGARGRRRSPSSSPPTACRSASRAPIVALGLGTSIGRRLRTARSKRSARGSAAFPPGCRRCTCPAIPARAARRR